MDAGIANDGNSLTRVIHAQSVLSINQSTEGLIESGHTSTIPKASVAKGSLVRRLLIAGSFPENQTEDGGWNGLQHRFRLPSAQVSSRQLCGLRWRLHTCDRWRCVAGSGCLNSAVNLEEIFSVAD